MRGLQSTRANVAGAITTALFVLVFCLILLWRNPLVFWNDDYQLSILPVFADVARSWSEGHLPLLSPYSWVCSNLAGEFQYGTFSIFVNAAVIVIWKMFASFAHQAAALSITHLVVLAIGAFVLARHRQFSMPLAMMVGFVAALNGWIICWGATDWFGALGAFTWLPWAWWSLEHAADDRSRWRFLWPAPFVYLVVTGGFPYTIVMLGLLATWVFFKTLFREKDIRSVVPIVIGVALGFGLSSPALLALFAYVHGSGREVQSASAHWQWLVPPTALPGLVLPSWTVKWADFSSRYVPHTAAEMACGLVAPVALLTGLLADARVLVRKLRWELLLLCTVLVIAMLPSAGVFRWSFRWLPFFHLLLAICAAEALRSFEILRGSRSVRFLRPGFIGFALVACTGLIMFIFHLGGRYALPLTWILVGLAAVWAVAEFLVIRTDLRPRSSGELHAAYRWLPATLTFIAFVATYLCIPPNCGVP
ncbi:MAG: hypothetical protein JWO45_1083, partial [Spartobacteria bacterium]|nr:hypothetical protein [Spartobacteria bacterium]